MRNGKAAAVDADVEARIAQVEQMTLDQIAVFQCRILTDITTGRIAPREASAIDAPSENRTRLTTGAVALPVRSCCDFMGQPWAELSFAAISLFVVGADNFLNFPRHIAKAGFI